MGSRYAFSFLRTLAALALLIPAVLAVGAAPDTFAPGIEGDGPSIEPAISADGRYVAFASSARNLVPSDENGLQDIFVRDRDTGETTRVSVSSDGDEADGYSERPAISADGRYVAFQSLATNLVAGDFNDDSDVFVHDRLNGETFLVSVNSAGEQGNDGSFAPAISASGDRIAFLSWADNLIATDENPWTDVFVHDLVSQMTVLVSASTAGAQPAGFAGDPSISADGRLVAFSFNANGLVPDDANDLDDIFVRDTLAGMTYRVTLGIGGADTDGESLDPAISADGQYVAYWSSARNLTDPPGEAAAVYVTRLSDGLTTLESVSSAGDIADGPSTRPRLSADGRRLAFASEARNLVSDDENERIDVYLRDRQSGITQRVSVSSGGEEGSGDTTFPSLSDSGLIVAFQSYADNLVDDDDNTVEDVFTRLQESGETVRVSLSSELVEGTAQALFLPLVVLGN